MDSDGCNGTEIHDVDDFDEKYLEPTQIVDHEAYTEFDEKEAEAFMEKFKATGNIGYRLPDSVLGVSDSHKSNVVADPSVPAQSSPNATEPTNQRANDPIPDAEIAPRIKIIGVLEETGSSESDSGKDDESDDENMKEESRDQETFPEKEDESESDSETESEPETAQNLDSENDRAVVREAFELFSEKHKEGLLSGSSRKATAVKDLSQIEMSCVERQPNLLESEPPGSESQAFAMDVVQTLIESSAIGQPLRNEFQAPQRQSNAPVLMCGAQAGNKTAAELAVFDWDPEKVIQVAKAAEKGPNKLQEEESAPIGRKRKDLDRNERTLPQLQTGNADVAAGFGKIGPMTQEAVEALVYLAGKSGKDLLDPVRSSVASRKRKSVDGKGKDEMDGKFVPVWGTKRSRGKPSARADRDSRRESSVAMASGAAGDGTQAKRRNPRGRRSVEGPGSVAMEVETEGSGGKDVRVLFSHSLSAQTARKLKKTVTSLGGMVTSSPLECTHFVTQNFFRTVNIMTALARGCHVAIPHWLDSSKAKGRFVDSKPYALRDLEKEEHFGFSLKAIHGASGALEGVAICVVGQTNPPKEDVAQIARAAGADVLDKPQFEKLLGTSHPSCVVIGSADDPDAYADLAQKRAAVHSVEFVMAAVLRHEVDFEKNKIVEASGGLLSARPTRRHAKPKITNGG